MYGDQARFFEDEIRQHLKHKAKGMVAMASASRSTCAPCTVFIPQQPVPRIINLHVAMLHAAIRPVSNGVAITIFEHRFLEVLR